VFHALDKVLAHYGTTTSNVVWLGIMVALLIAGFCTARRASRSVLDDVIAEPLAGGRP
jgi:hypothetical protein